MISGIEAGEQAIGALWIAGRFVKIKDCVEMAGIPNPLIDRLPVCLVCRSWVIISGTCIGEDRCAEYCNAVRMCPHNDLFVSGQNPLHQFGMFGGIDFAAPRQTAQIVHALKDDQITYSRLREDVTIKARQGTRPQAVREQMVAADAVVENPKHAVCRRLLQSLRQNVGPAIIPVGSSAVSVRNGISQDDNGCASGAGRHVHARKLIPVIHFLSIGQVGSRHQIPMRQIGCGSGAGMTCLGCGRFVKVNTDREVTESRYGILDWVGEVLGSCRYGYVRSSVKAQSLVAGSVNPG